MVAHDVEVYFSPFISASTPAGLAHQTYDGFLLGPALLYGYVGQVGRAVAAAVVGEGYAQAVGADGPVEGSRGRLEVGEEGDGDFEAGEFAGGDRGEACIVKGTTRKKLATHFISTFLSNPYG